MVVREPNAAEPGATKTMASAVEDRTAAKPAAVEYGAAGSQAATMKHRTAAAVERCGPTMKSAATVETATAVEASAAAMKAAATSATVETTTTTTAPPCHRHRGLRSSVRRRRLSPSAPRPD